MEHKLFMVCVIVMNVSVCSAAENKAAGIAAIGAVVGAGELYGAITAHNVQEVKALLELGANPNAICGSGFTRIMLGVALQTYTPGNVASKEIIQVLLQHGASANSRTPSQDYPLYMAVKKGCHEVVGLLLAAKAREHYGASLRWAVNIKNLKMVDVFMKHSYINTYIATLNDNQKQELVDRLATIGCAFSLLSGVKIDKRKRGD